MTSRPSFLFVYDVPRVRGKRARCLLAFSEWGRSGGGKKSTDGERVIMHPTHKKNLTRTRKVPLHTCIAEIFKNCQKSNSQNCQRIPQQTRVSNTICIISLSMVCGGGNPPQREFNCGGVLLELNSAKFWVGTPTHTHTRKCPLGEAKLCLQQEEKEQQQLVALHDQKALIFFVKPSLFSSPKELGRKKNLFVGNGVW